MLDVILSLSFQACEPGLGCGVLAVETGRSVIRVSGQSGWNLGNMGALGIQHVKLKEGVPRQLQVVQQDYEWGAKLWGPGLRQPVEKLSRRSWRRHKKSQSSSACHQLWPQCQFGF